MTDCWICGDVADSEEHKFKASDIKRFHGKKADAYYVSGEAIKINSYKDKNLKFPRVICTHCNNTRTRPHDDAYDIFTAFCYNNYLKILEFSNLNWEAIYGRNWEVEKMNLYRYYAKHAGCKIVSSNISADLSNLAGFIKRENPPADFILSFEQKEGVEAIMNVFNREHKYNHLYNSESTYWDRNINVKFGGWLTNNYMTTNWVFGRSINGNSLNMHTKKEEPVILTDVSFFDLTQDEMEDDDEFSKLKFIDQYFVGFENGYNKTTLDKVEFYKNLILYSGKI